MSEYSKPAEYCCGCTVISIKYANNHKCLLSKCAVELQLMADLLSIEGQDELYFTVQSTYNQVRGMMRKVNEESN